MEECIVILTKKELNLIIQALKAYNEEKIMMSHEVLKQCGMVQDDQESYKEWD